AARTRARGGLALSPRLVGLLTAAAAGLATWIAFTPPSLPWNAPLQVRVEAGALGEINSGAWVEMNGARIGSVDRIDFKDGHAVLELSLNRVSGLHANATASIQPHGLLGPKFVALGAGDRGTLRDGA